MNKKAYSIGAILLLAMSISMTRAQQVAKPGQEGERIVTSTNLVTINVIVTDRDGRYIKSLKREQFEVYDEKVKQQIAHFSNGSRPFLLNTEASIGRAVLAEMARVSGGATYFPESENEPELMGICAQIALELRQQYTLGFYPTEPARKKNWHRIRVHVDTGRNSRGIVLSYRQGYRRINQQQVGYLTDPKSLL